MTKDEALNLALDCVSTLANARDWVGCTPNERWDEDEMYAELCNATICLKKSLSIIQEALAEQPAQKRPQNCGTGYCSCIECLFEQPNITKYLEKDNSEQPAQEPVAWMNPYGGLVHKRITGHERNNFTIPLYTSPQPAQPNKPFVGLTDEEIEKLSVESGKATFLNDDEQTGILWFDGDCMSLARAIEAKLREKNAQPSKPLTDEEIGKIAGDCLDPWSCARAIEAAHGIKGDA